MAAQPNSATPINSGSARPKILGDKMVIAPHVAIQAVRTDKRLTQRELETMAQQVPLGRITRARLDQFGREKCPLLSIGDEIVFDRGHIGRGCLIKPYFKYTTDEHRFPPTPGHRNRTLPTQKAYELIMTIGRQTFYLGTYTVSHANLEQVSADEFVGFTPEVKSAVYKDTLGVIADTPSSAQTAALDALYSEGKLWAVKIPVLRTGTHIELECSLRTAKVFFQLLAPFACG
ncbi:hypothetical protein PLICRDRAFT_35376 [Plicaturopsis crispa FD-325 SS-3]|nr:hypothetical protein PLICRDRAFT_35376 [Plicaturopsis crispa FD-325 SS-3]